MEKVLLKLLENFKINDIYAKELLVRCKTNGVTSSGQMKATQKTFAFVKS